MTRTLSTALIASLTTLCLTASAGAQGLQGPPGGQMGLAGTTWTGSETLAGFGTLRFEFLAGGKVVMTDAKDRVEGVYALTGAQVKLAFFDGGVIYSGTLKGQQMSGTATNGKSSWSWTVQRQGGKPAPAPMPGGGNNGFGGNNGPGGGQAQGKLTPQGLPEYLRGLGYQPEAFNPPNGTPYCVLKLKNDAGWNFVLEVAVNKDGGVWLTAPLGQLPQGQAPGARLLPLLEANNVSGPCFFAYRAADNRIVLKLEVIGTQANRFRADVTLLCNVIQRTYSLWNPNAWQGNNAGAGAN